MNKQTAILKLMATAKALEKGQLYPEGAEKDFGFILDEYHKAESQKSDSLPIVSKSYSGEEFRIVKYYHGFFCHWAYRLEKKVSWWFFGRRTGWEQVAGNGNTDSIPDEWRSFNIVEEIELSVGTKTLN